MKRGLLICIAISLCRMVSCVGQDEKVEGLSDQKDATCIVRTGFSQIICLDNVIMFLEKPLRVWGESVKGFGGNLIGF